MQFDSEITVYEYIRSCFSILQKYLWSNAEIFQCQWKMVAFIYYAQSQIFIP